MRLLHVSDLHGSVKALELTKELYFKLEADLLVVSGDLSGKCVSNGRVTRCVWGRRKDPKEMGEELFLASGGYFVNAPDREVERNAPGLLAKAAAARIGEWLGDLKEAGVKYFVIAGNVDHPYMDEVLEGEEATFFGLKFCGLSYVPYTPFGTYRETSEARLKEMLPKNKCDVLVSHTPPKGFLDYSNYHEGGHVGSTAVREWIEKNGPLLSLHGHVHESRGVARVGKTLAVNPGSEAEHGALLYAVIDLDGEPTAALGEVRY